ncbi:MAG: ABC transporter ATP-binding protein [Immundisolibacterales bacterium]|nr:ABC transporter ATP-binding protein [Immundisolibacterales bacterium]
MRLEVRGLHSYYGRAHILADVSLEATAGEVVALLGRNGAGKSTTLKSIIGLVRPAGGTVEVDGTPISGEPPHRICRRGLGYVPEERRVFASLTVGGNLEVGRQPPRPGLTPWTPARLFELFPNLAGMGGRAAGQMSGGEQQMLTIARTLMGNPALVLLDEPSEGLAPVIVDQMVQVIRSLKREGLAIVLSEQNVNFAMKVADRAYIIEKGRIRHECTIDALMADEAMRRTYLTV